MLADISWGAYAASIIAFVLVWYGFVYFRYYYKNISSVFKGRSGSRSSVGKNEKRLGPFSEYSEPFDTLEDAEDLYNRLLGVFSESNDRGVSKAEFRHYLQFVLAEYPFVRQSALRDKINSLTVLESRKHSEFLLSAEEMDRLWDNVEK
ncbi:hypothetical protein [Flavobacterium ginsenosidimutans]|uniref:hypothetical protein n=1 Tax=Flavobacterium ginsenosidimutans TaxID=687844 RepID=UPI000DAF2A72|nr:hypothetical protein [Flavobacterium ginsenosidimutans]KAF2328130.1 hypothetical protein DM444_20290 [Flavobacterium ginsenosidimutans]